MITEGEAAPEFELPAVVDGAFGTVSLADHRGEKVVVLAFYPADFNPSCTDERSGLSDLDLFTMQKDVAILGISGDSLYSHRRFAEAYDLDIPLAADVDGAVAGEYGVALDDPDAGYQTRRAVFVVDPEGTVQYAWVADDLDQLPDIDAVREAVESVSGDDIARARYRVGHAHYVEGRRAFTSAMSAFEGNEWMVARKDFERAREEFEEAAALFDTAVRFGEDETARTCYERAEAKAEALWQAADWLGGSASAFASGEGREGQSKRDDARTPLETAREIHEPPAPEEFPLDDLPETDTETADRSLVPSENDDHDTSLSVDLDEDAQTGEETVETASGEQRGDTDTAASDGTPATADAGEGTTAESGEPDDTGDDGEGEEIDDAELEEITAELEEQTERARAKMDAEDAETDDGTEAADGNGPTDAADVEDDLDEAEIELDLTDPTETDDEERDGDDGGTGGTGDDMGDGSHGVPDTL